MDTNTILLLLITGLAAGMLSGLIGIGGGILIVPALVYLLVFSQKAAQGNSLAILLLPVGLLGVIQYYKQGYVDWRVVGLVALGFALGSYFGSKLALSLSDLMLKKVFAIILLLLSLKMLFLDKPKKTAEKPSEQAAKIHKT
ncbi:MAG TPA: permease [Chitinophagaceae bacterium]|nr:permease [Chitinophagaceae bacterium]